jgi:hypothetical protein
MNNISAPPVEVLCFFTYLNSFTKNTRAGVPACTEFKAWSNFEKHVTSFVVNARVSISCIINFFLFFFNDARELYAILLTKSKGSNT